jgi:hypothetical protein
MIGGLQILSGARFPLWMLFGEASLSAHIILSVVGILTMLGSMAFSAAAFRSWFRLYWLISLAAVVTFFGLALSDAPEVNAEERSQHASLASMRASPSVPTSGGCVLVTALWRRRVN